MKHGELKLREAIKRIQRARQQRRKQHTKRLTQQIQWLLGPGLASTARQFAELIQGLFRQDD